MTEKLLPSLEFQTMLAAPKIPWHRGACSSVAVGPIDQMRELGDARRHYHSKIMPLSSLTASTSAQPLPRLRLLLLVRLLLRLLSLISPGLLLRLRSLLS